MKFITELKAQEEARVKKIQYLKDKILQREKQIQRLENRRNKVSHWTEALVRPIITEVARLTPEIKWDIDKDRFYPMGLRCAVSVFGRTKDDVCVGITFTPNRDGELPMYDYQYGKRDNTIGGLNGFNHKSKPIESIDELVNFVRSKTV